MIEDMFNITRFIVRFAAAWIVNNASPTIAIINPEVEAMLNEATTIIAAPIQPIKEIITLQEPRELFEVRS